MKKGTRNEKIILDIIVIASEGGEIEKLSWLS